METNTFEEIMSEGIKLIIYNWPGILIDNLLL